MDGLSLHLETAAGQSRFTFDVLLASLSAEHVVDPSAVGLKLDTSVKHDSEVEPSSGVTDSTDLIGHVLLSILAHAAVQLLVGVQVVEVGGDLSIVAGSDEVARLAVLNLKRNTTSTAGNDGASSMKSLRHLDFEALASGELESNTGVGHQCVEN